MSFEDSLWHSHHKPSHKKPSQTQKDPPATWKKRKEESTPADSRVSSKDYTISSSGSQKPKSICWWGDQILQRESLCLSIRKASWYIWSKEQSHCGDDTCMRLVHLFEERCVYPYLLICLLALLRWCHGAPGNGVPGSRIPKAGKRRQRCLQRWQHTSRQRNCRKTCRHSCCSSWPPAPYGPWCLQQQRREWSQTADHALYLWGASGSPALAPETRGSVNWVQRLLRWATTQGLQQRQQSRSPLHTCAPLK